MMRKLMLCIAFLAGLMLLDRGIGAAMRAAYDRTSTGEAGGQINDALRHGDRELIVFGSSLARHHVDPDLLSARLGWSGFNAGCNGQDIYYARMLQSLLVGRGCTPRHFVYVVNWRDLVQDDVDRARMFSVFADESPAVRNILAPSLVERLKLQSHAYRFNTLAISTLRQLLAPQQVGKDGFVSMAVDYQPVARDFADMDRDLRQGLTSGERSVAEAKLALYGEFATAARRRNIGVTFVVGPTYRDGRVRGHGERWILEQLSAVAGDSGANFLVLDETTVAAFQAVDYYGDPRHLNTRGAAFFSRLLAECLCGMPHDVAKMQHDDDSRRR